MQVLLQAPVQVQELVWELPQAQVEVQVAGLYAILQGSLGTVVRAGEWQYS